nr:cGMP-dependent protein kinase, isozyme 1-like [Leptinotarsa decemlineata]
MNSDISSVVSRPSADSQKDLLGRRRSGVTPVRFVPKEDDKLPVHKKDPEDERLIRTAIENNEFLNKIISEQRIIDVIAAMYIRKVSSKEILIKQGDKGSHMYVSAKGKYQTIIKGKVVNEFDNVRVFGELAILYNAKRLATIRAVTSGMVWVLDSNVYQQIVIRHNIREQDETMNFLMNNEYLKVVGKDALQVVANLLKSEFFPTGKEIVRQGDKGHKFYIIRAGTVTITKDKEGVVGVYRKGDCFGELALLEEDCRQATVTADAPGVECLTLTRKEFIDHLGEIKNFKYIRVTPKDSIKPAAAEHGELNLLDLKIRKTLGVGGFGRVELVQHIKDESLVFALKYLKKVDVVAQCQEEHVYNEKTIQMACNSPFIVRLYRTFKDQKYIYFLMESCLGGDLWSMLQKQKNRRFEEKDARFICACVLEAFDYLHSRGVIFRDLKPENLLIALNGYIKLTDFGFAKKLSGQSKTFTFAGTPEYVAPEIVLNRGHNRAVDYWAYGAFIFEMLTGRTPFRTDDSSHMRTYNKILSGIDNISFPTYVNLKARHLIEKLCQPVPSERLGMSKGGIQDIKNHKWYLGFDWPAFVKLQMPSPFKPKLSSPIDTKYFDQFKRDNDTPPDELSGWDDSF